MEIKLNFTEDYGLFNLVMLGSFYMIGYGVYVIISPHSFQWIVFKPCIHLVNLLKMCIWSFDEDEINIDRIIVF